MKRFNVLSKYVLVGTTITLIFVGGIGIGTLINNSSKPISQNYQQNGGNKKENDNNGKKNNNNGGEPEYNPKKIEKLVLNQKNPVVLSTYGSTINNPYINEVQKGLTDIYGENATNLTSNTVSKTTNDIYNNFVKLESRVNDNGIIVAVGDANAEAIKKYRKERPQRKTKFLLVGGNSDATNTLNVNINVRRTAFQVGYLTGLYLEIIKKDANPKVGMWGATNNKSVTNYLIGFIAGIKYYNDHNPANKPDVSIIKFTNNDDYTNAGKTMNGVGKTRADYLVKNGADVILPASGVHIMDAINAVGQTGTKIIGVDVDLTSIFSKTMHSLFLTSITKEIRKAVYDGYLYLKNKSGPLKTYPFTFISNSENDCDLGLMRFSNERGLYTDYIKQYASNSYKTHKETDQTDAMKTAIQKQWETIYDKVKEDLKIKYKASANGQITVTSNPIADFKFNSNDENHLLVSVNDIDKPSKKKIITWANTLNYLQSI